MPAISVKRLTKSFDSLVAVDNVSFSVEEGTIFGFLGPNGAGKTTTINILCTLMKPTSGTAVVNGYNCVSHPSEIRRSIGIVFQDQTLDKELTAFENLYYHAILYGVERSRRRRLVDDALNFAGLYQRRDDIVKRFSGGMKRRLEVARAVVHQPKILFLDEPTLGLDPQSRMNLWEFISALPGEKGVTVFMTTHYMDEAEVCNRIAIIDNGKIIASGSPDELKKGIGGDVVYLKTTDNAESIRLLSERFSLTPTVEKEYIFIPVSRGDAWIPELIRALGERVLSVRLQRPTLNDVFLKLTGKAIREEPATGNDEMRETVRAYRRKFDRG
jgi:ABC-2 type transport system ATP-binding protein